MIYYENGKGEIIGRMYEAGSGWVAEIGRLASNAFVPFFATKSARFKTHRLAEKYLLENGCVMIATA